MGMSKNVCAPCSIEPGDSLMEKFSSVLSALQLNGTCSFAEHGRGRRALIGQARHALESGGRLRFAGRAIAMEWFLNQQQKTKTEYQALP
jgi:hypothetical protein